MSVVMTTQGLVPRERLEPVDVVTETENSRSVATEWYLDGQMVRRDVAVSILAPQSIGAEQGG